MRAIPNAPGALALIRAEFDRCWPLLEPAVREGGDRHTADTIWQGIVTGRFQFWPGVRSAAVTHVDQFVNSKVLRLWLVGGDLDEILAHEPVLAQWALDVGCTELELVGRRGWERVLEPLGYTPGHIVVKRRLENVTAERATGDGGGTG